METLPEDSGLVSQSEWSSNGQTMPSLGTAGADHGTAALGGHTDEKAMSAFTADHRRLIGAFHDMALDFVANRNVGLDIDRALFVKQKILFLSFLWITFPRQVRITPSRLCGLLA